MAGLNCKLSIPCVSLTKFMLERFRLFPNKVAIIDPGSGRSITFTELSLLVRRVARGLRNIGFQKGDILCMLSPNVVEYNILFYAVASHGGIFQATNPEYTPGELKHVFDLCQPKFAFTLPGLVEKITKTGTSSVKTIIVLGEADGCLSFDKVISPETSPEQIDDVSIDPKNDVVALLFSSGTTGLPKAVKLSHFNFIAIACQSIATKIMMSSDCFITFLPNFHIFGLGPIMTSGLASGSCAVCMPRFIPELFLKNIERYKVSMFFSVPPALVVLSNLPEKLKFQYDRRHVRKIFCGAAPLSKEIESKITKMFGIDFIIQGYGLTECAAATCSTEVAHRFGSVGTLLADTECKVVDPETQAVLGMNKKGEVWLRGPQVMLGYYENPRATVDMLDDDKWLHTGDVGHMDEDGFLYIVDRIKELIKYKGFQVAPAELEDLLLHHPAVADVGVIGVPDFLAGELPKAFVVKKPGVDVSQDDLVQFVKSKVSDAKHLRGGVEFVPQIPKSASGKILRRILRTRSVKHKL